MNAIVATDDTTYIGGTFSYVGPATGSGAPLDMVSGIPAAVYPKVDGYIFAAAPDGLGGWYIGGLFARVGEVDRENLAHILGDGSVDLNWDPRATSDNFPSVYALAVSGSTVYAGGWFKSIGGQDRLNIAALDASTGVATGWNPGTDGFVHTLAVSGSTVYAGGNFSYAGGQERSCIAALDAETGAATAWNPNANGFVHTLAVSGSTVYAGGAFTSIGGQSRNCIAALDTATGAATAWDPSVGGDSYPEVWALAVSGSTVYAGGWFTGVGGQNRNYIAAVDAATGEVKPWNPNANNCVRALAVIGTTVYAAGTFTGIGGEARNYMAGLDVSTGVANSWNPNANDFVYSLAENGAIVYAGGEFTSVGGQDRKNIAAFDAETGAVTVWNPNVDGSVNALAVSGTTVYAGGDFTSVGGQTRNYIAAVDAATGAATAWNPNVSGCCVHALAVSGSTVYAGGSFAGVGGQTRINIAALDAATGEVQPWNPNANDYVYALAVSGATVYAGGDFTSIGGQTRSSIAAVDAATGAATAWNPNANRGVYPSTVRALAVSGSTVYAGGVFTNIGGQDRNNIAAVDAATGSAAAWNPNANDYVIALAVSGSTVYAGGWFTGIGGQTRNYLAALDEATGAATAWNPNVAGDAYDPYPSVSAVAVSGAALFTGGRFKLMGGDFRPQFAEFRDVPALPHAISGTVKDGSGSPMAQVAISLAGAATRSGETGANGTYSFSDLLDGVYTVTPTKDSYAFTPSKRSVNVAGEDVGGQDFSGGPATGSVMTTISPQGAVDAGAKWKLDSGGAWMESGTALSGVAPGSHTLIFGAASGWIAPSSQPITVEPGKTAAASGVYVDSSATAPKAPTAVKAVPGDGQATVSFNAPASDGGSPILYYTVTSSPGGVTQTGASSPITVTGLTNGISCTFKVTATNGVGTGPASAKSNKVKPSGPTAPKAPTGVKAVAGSGRATVSFKAPSSDGGSPILYYTVTSNPGGVTQTGAASPITVTGLSNRTPYTFTVTATNAIGTGPASSKSNSVKPVAPTAPKAPRAVKATAGNAQATISFSPPASDGGSPILSYAVTSSPGGLTQSGALSPITVTGLTNGTVYAFKVTATNAIGTGPSSARSNTVRPLGGK